MLGAVERSPDQWRAALERADHAPVLTERAEDVRAVLVAGMGGSGIAGDVAATAADERCDVPVIPVKGPALPRYADRSTPLIAVSYSGGTAETLACLEDAVRRGLPACVVTSGGRAESIALDHGLGVARLPGGGQPRANLPHLAGAVLAILARSRLLPGILDELAGVPDHLDSHLSAWSHDRPERDNAVKRLAVRIGRSLPVFYGARGWMALAALRAKCQVNENAERPAFHNEVPELEHNEVVGWSHARARSDVTVVQLRDRQDPSPLDRHLDALRPVIDGGLSAVIDWDVHGPTPLARFAAAVLAVDLLSVYLAVLEGHDPTPVAAIDELKRRTSTG